MSTPAPLVESPASEAKPVSKAHGKLLWTVESARQAGLKSAALRAQRKANGELNGNGQPKLTESAQPNANQALPVANGTAERHRAGRLSRVRLLLDRLDAMLEKEKDPGKLDRLAAASAKLEEQERRLSDRSLPPVLRSDQKRPGRSSAMLEE